MVNAVGGEWPGDLARQQAPGATSFGALSTVWTESDSLKHLLNTLNTVVSTGKRLCESGLLPGPLGAREGKAQRHDSSCTNNFSVY